MISLLSLLALLVAPLLDNFNFLFS